MGLTDTQTDSFEFEEQLRQLREQRETGGTKKRKDNSFHAFGLSDALYSTKNEQGKNERNFKQMCRQVEEGIAERERKMVELQHKQSIRKSISLMTQEQKRTLSVRLQTMDEQDKTVGAQTQFFGSTKRSVAGAFTRKGSLSKKNSSPVEPKQSIKVSQALTSAAQQFRQSRASNVRLSQAVGERGSFCGILPASFLTSPTSQEKLQTPE